MVNPEFWTGQSWILNWSVNVFPKRLASLLIVTQLVNQVTEVVIPFLVDQLISAPHRAEKEDDPQEDKLRNQGTLPVFPVSTVVKIQGFLNVICNVQDSGYVLLVMLVFYTSNYLLVSISYYLLIVF